MKPRAFWKLKQVAFRNLARHKVKTALSILAIAVSVAAYIWADAWLVGMNIDSKRNIVNYETGAAKLQPRAYVDKLDEKPMYENFGAWREYAEGLTAAGYKSAPRFVFAGTLYSSTGTAPVVFNAVDPGLDAEVLQVDSAVDMGRWVKPGGFEIVLGNQTSDKLKLAVPSRITEKELETELLPLVPEREREFVRSLYDKPKSVSRPYSTEALDAALSESWTLKRGIPKEDADKLWALLSDTGRMNAQISTVIDIKASPESVRGEKYEADLAPFFTPEEEAIFKSAYEWDALTGAWLLSSADEALLDAVLAAMVRVDYTGAIRHINQLIPVVVAGTVNSPDPQINNNTAWIPLDVLGDESGLMLNSIASGGAVTELIIRKTGSSAGELPGKDESAQAITASLEKSLAASGGGLPPDMAVFEWEEYVKDYIAASSGDNWSTRIMVIILFVLSFLGISNTMLLAILERTKEIGMMRAQGMTDGELIFTMMLEAAGIGLIGAAAGMIIGCAANYPMVKYGIDFSAMTEAMGGDTGYRINGVYRSAWNIPVVFITGIAAALIAAVMAYFPTRRALKMPVTESLRFE